jgi:hypothetical protein
VLAAGLTVCTTEVEDVDGGPPGGVLAGFLAMATTEVGDTDGGPPGGGGGAGGPGAPTRCVINLHEYHKQK